MKMHHLVRLVLWLLILDWANNSFMTYQETLNWMFSQLPMYQKQGKLAFKAKLDNIKALAKHLGSPEKRFKSIHVAGTNGKGSTSHMLASVFQEAGYKVGLYTSPHLKDFRERIKINGLPISEQEVVEFITEHKLFFENHDCSFFEMTVGMAYDFFAANQVDIAIIEVGLGGRLDSTNIITPEVSVITNIGLDHTDMLGDTLEQIAYEKAGIIKPGVPVVISEYHQDTYPVFKQVAETLGSDLYLGSELLNSYESDLRGHYQKRNIKGVVTAIHLLKSKFKISESDIVTGLSKVVVNTGLLGRWQQLQQSPLVIADTAHNKEGLSMVLQQLIKTPCEKLHIVLGVVKDKNLQEILPVFPRNAEYYFCQPEISRALDVEVLKNEAAKFLLNGSSYVSVSEAYMAAKKNAGPGDCIYIGGSTFVVAEII